MSVEVKDQVSDVSVESPAVEAAGSEGGAPQGASEKEPKEGAPAQPAPAEEGEGEPEKAAAYKPRDKFKVMDQEHDVPAWLKGALKDEATEKEAIELLEKSFGLEHVKPKLVETRKERDHFKSELAIRDQAIGDARDCYQRGDIDLFLNKLDIPHERMLQWALDKVQYSQLPPEQQRMIDDRRDAQRNAVLSERKASTYEQQVYEQARQAKQTLLQSGLERPEVKSLAAAYDAKVGKPGAFFEEVRTTGELAWIQSNGKVDLTPDQAIEQTISKWKNFVQPTAPGPTAPGAEAPKVVSATKPAVIPNVQGRTSSPMKSSPRSIDDLKKLRDKAGTG